MKYDIISHVFSGKQAHLYRYLQRIINSYGYKEEYINDERMMKMWFKLADSKSGQLSGSVLLERAFNAGCCRCLAKFYVRWAEIREDANDISGARTVLELGRRNNAQPGEMLIAASDALEMRQIRLLSEEDSDLEWSQPEEYEEQRLALGGLKGIGRNKAAPAMRFAERTAEGLLSNHQDLQSSTKPQQKSVFTVFEGSPCDEPILVPQDFTAELGHVEFVQNTKDPMKWKDARITGSRKCVARENPTFRVFDETAYQQKRHDKKELSKNSKLVVANEVSQTERKAFIHNVDVPASMVNNML
ncbi:hypothetical protein AB6A40_010389 [Gnathostoma spinigerum]|uniref:BUB1 N-terminal domain-containing protein n=1 Tax=Gnathostoma spinigerum TaxID=75299 RepID=A0ABD6EW11_9BILA